MALSRAALANDVAAAFLEVGDVALPGEFHRYDGSYDTNTQETTRVEAPGSPYTLPRVVLYDSTEVPDKERQAELGGQYPRKFDIRAIFEQADLPVRPDDNDELVVGSTTYIVKEITEDPASVIWDLGMLVKT